MDILKRIDQAQQFCKFYADGAYSIETEKWNHHVTPEFIEDIRQYIESLQLKLMHEQTTQAVQNAAPELLAALKETLLVRLQTIAAPLPQGFQRCAHVAPRPESGTQRYNYTLNGIGLECDIEFEAEDGDGWNEPREPATATLCKAWVRDVNIAKLLDEDQVAEIEDAFLTQGVEA